MAGKIYGVYMTYGPSLGDVGFKLETCTMLEWDMGLRNALERAVLDGISVETNPILRLKGLEKTCVIRSTRIQNSDEEEAKECVYTILTRSAALLIIALFPNAHTSYFSILNTFIKEKLIIWESETSHHIDSFCLDRARANGAQ